MFCIGKYRKKPVLSQNNLLTTVAWDIGDGIEYALEGSVFVGGAVIQWVRDQLKIIKNAAETEKLALSVENTGGVFLVPAFVGLGAPYWDSDCRGTILGITRGTSDAHIVRAALESIAYLSRDLIEALQEDSGKKIHALKVDGGASANKFLMQFQADILGIPVVQSALPETTALGSAYLAGLHCGYWDTKETIKNNWRVKEKFDPKLNIYKRQTMIETWFKAVKATREFKI